MADGRSNYQFASFGYDATNKLVSRDQSNPLSLGSVSSIYEYDGLDRLKRLQHTRNIWIGWQHFSNAISDVQYDYNTASQITQQTENVDSSAQSYSYDLVDRLIGGQHQDGQVGQNPALPNGHPATESYSFDGVGNRTASHLSASYGYQPFNRLVSTDAANYTFDNNGNLLSKTDASGTTTFTWDTENRLTQVTLPNALVVSYQYDALGRRIKRSAGTDDVTKFVYDGADVIEDLDTDGNVINNYLNGPGIDNIIRRTDADNGDLYYLTDHLGSTIALSDGSGNVVEGIRYDSFGNSTGSELTRYTYTGRERQRIRASRTNDQVRPDEFAC